MAEPAFDVGFLRKLAGAVESAYGVEALVTQMIPFISESITKAVPLQRQPVLQGRANVRQSVAGVPTFAGDVTFAWRYTNGQLFFVNWFGEYNAATGVYTHIATTAGQSLTLALRRRVGVRAFLGWKTNSLTINGAVDAVTVTASGYVTDDIQESILNTEAVLDALVNTDPDISYRHFVVRIGEQDNLLTSADELGVATVTLTLPRPLDQVITNQGLDEPGENAFPDLTVAFEVARERNYQWEDWKDAKTELQMQILISNGTTIYTITLPNLEIQEQNDATQGPQAVTIPVTLIASEAERELISSSIYADYTDNSLNIAAGDAGAATGTLTLTGGGQDAETTTIGTRVYEIDTETYPGNATAGRVRVDLDAAAVKAQGTLTVDTQPTAGDTMTIGSTVYTFVTALNFNTAGEISIGASLAGAQLAIRAAVNGTDGINTANAQATMAAFAANDAVVSARAGGTAGNSIATTETFTAGTNVFDAATLGTTTAGVNPTAQATITALVAAINADPDRVVTAVDGPGETMDVTAIDVGTAGNMLATTDTMANASWGATTLLGGLSGDADVMPYGYPGATAWLSGLTQFGGVTQVAEVVLRTDTKLVLTDAAGGGVDLTDEAAGDLVTIVLRSPDIIMEESQALT